MKTLAQLRALGLFDARVPRYTSYPTAPHFKTEVGNAVVTPWIKAIPAGGAVSVYVHVPFCRRLCWFCACRTQGTATAEPVAAYVETLKQELAQMKALLAPGVEIEHLHFGGGTPTLLQPDMISDLTAAIFEMAPLAEGAQFSVEIDPTEVDEARIAAFADAGLTRASIGVQDFDPMIQETIGRPQSYEITRDAVEALRARGIRSLNVDLLYGLPHQTEARITDSVNKVISLGPDRIARVDAARWVGRLAKLNPLRYDAARTVDCVEISPGVVEAAGRFFEVDRFSIVVAQVRRVATRAIVPMSGLASSSMPWTRSPSVRCKKFVSSRPRAASLPRSVANSSRRSRNIERSRTRGRAASSHDRIASTRAGCAGYVVSTLPSTRRSSSTRDTIRKLSRLSSARRHAKNVTAPRTPTTPTIAIIMRRR